MKAQRLLMISSTVFLLLNVKCALASSSQAVMECSPSSLSFRTDDKEGYFNGMSHSGVLLVVHNTGSHACSIPARAVLGFENAKHRPVNISLKTPAGMSPGPVLLPLTVPAEGWATSEMRWVSGQVYDKNVCLSPAFMTLSIGKNKLRVPFNGTICGPAGANPTYTLTLFKLDATYGSPSTSQSE